MSPEDYTSEGAEGDISSYQESNKYGSKFTLFLNSCKNTIKNSISKIKSAFKKVDRLDDRQHRIDDISFMKDIQRMRRNEQIHRMKRIRKMYRNR